VQRRRRGTRYKLWGQVFRKGARCPSVLHMFGRSRQYHYLSFLKLTKSQFTLKFRFILFYLVKSFIVGHALLRENFFTRPETSLGEPDKIATFMWLLHSECVYEGKQLWFRLVQLNGTTLTTHVVQSIQGLIRSDVKFWPIHSLGQFLHQNLSIPVEHIHKILQHFEVESWSKQLAVGCPVLPCRTAI